MPYPTGVPKWRRFLRFWRADVAADVDDELRFHFEARAEELRARGVAAADVERTILEEFGDVEATRGRLREIGERVERRRERRWWWHQLLADLRYALRGLRRTPGFTAAVVVTLALGIGANAAIFSAVDRLLFRAPPMLDAPARTHRVYVSYPLPDASGERFVLDVVPYARYRELGAWTTSFERTALHVAYAMAVGTGQEARELPVAAVSASFFGFFDAPPALGRYFGAAEDAPPAGAPVAVLSHATWQSRFGGRREVLGATLQIGPTAYTVIGVAPQGFVGLWPEQPPIAFLPVSSYAAGTTPVRPRAAAWWNSYTMHVASMLVRRKPGVPLSAASSDLGGALLRSIEAEGGAPASLLPQAVVASIVSERGPNQTSAARVAALVGAMALVVLLIACANVANLLLARALGRRREIAVRLALGVSRGRLLSHLLTESVLLASAGGVAGLLVAQWGGAALRAAILPPGAASPVMGDVRTLVFVGIAVLVVGVVTGLAPAWQARRVELTRDLRLGVREGTPHHARTRVALLVVQGALSVLLLVGAGLFVRSLRNVQHLRLGYDVAPVLTVGLNMRGVRLDSARTAALRERLLVVARAVPGVERAALSAHVPLGGTTFMGAVRVPGMDPETMRRLPRFHRNVVTPEYFATMGTRIVRGRGFGPADVAGAPGAMVVSGAMARTLWPGRDALGQCVKLRDEETTPCTLVVGIAEDIRHSELSDDPALLYYLPAAQATDVMGLMVRTRGDASRHVEAVRQALQREMPGESYLTVAPFADVVGEGMRSWRLGARMFAVFGVLALVLAAVGLYGVIAYEVTQRSHEMGVRMALGARAADVLWIGVRRGVLLAGLGIVLGGAVALSASGRIAPLLFDVSPRDPLVYAGVAAAMLIVAAAASYIPARRAARVDPSVVLRSE